jgi:signal transduction histidine kinase
MRLRQRLVLTFILLSIILLAPSVWSLTALRELRQITYELSTRDAVGALTLGRLQTAFSEVDNAQRIYLALATSEARERVEAGSARVTQELTRLARGGYEEVVAPAAAEWERVREAITEEQRLVEAREVEAADAHRDGVVDPAFARMDAALDPIGRAINEVGAQQVERAQAIAVAANTSTVLGLIIALLVALAIGAWSTRSLLRPIDRLRGGMAVVAGGDFEPEVRIPPDRPDEIGDLARSFARMTDQLAALDRMKAEFVSVASHELKTPLSVIKGYVSLLRDGVYGDVPDQQVKVLVSVGEQTDRLGRLIQQLLDVSRFEAGGGRLEIKPIDLRAFLNDLKGSFEVLAYQNEIDFSLEVADTLPETLNGDSDRLNEVLGNLLSNAFKFTQRGGSIRIIARPSRTTEEGVLIEVVDTGVGIPAELLPRVFDKFFQVENQAQPRSMGSGLGLAIAREIVDAHGGTIGAESQVGKGTTFRVVLPLEPPVTEAA